mmetsp:Transcript_39006/g.76697  ORF Transcript_39006/g.76697 Transcript_39006/m.76697 type:complete len:460 (-) Transcript_39006:569-1948(-)
MEDRVHQRLRGFGEGLAEIVPSLLQLTQNLIDGVEHVQVGRRADVSLVGREGENRHCNLLVLVGLPAKGRPLGNALSEERNTVRHRDVPSSHTLTSSEDERLDSTIDLGQRDLQCHLHRVESELALLPLLEGLKHKRQSAQVGPVQFLQHLHGLRMVLRRWPPHECESRQVHHRVHSRLPVFVVKKFLQRTRVIETSRVDGDHTESHRLQLCDEGRVVSCVLGVDMGLLHQHAHGRGSVDVNACLGAVHLVVPLQIGLRGLEHLIGHRVPDSLGGKEDGLGDAGTVNQFLAGNSLAVGVGDVQQQSAEVLGGTIKPVLKGGDEVPSVLRLFHREVLQDLRERADELEHVFLKFGSSLCLHFLHEVADGALLLPGVAHREVSHLLQPHHLRKGREDQTRVKLISEGSHCLNHLLRQLLNKNQGPDENIGIRKVGLQPLHVLRISQLLKQITNALNRHPLL